MDVYGILLMVVLTMLGYVISSNGTLKYVINLINSFLFYVSIPLTTIIKISFMNNESEFLITLAISLLHIFTILIVSFVIAKMYVGFIDAISISIALSMPNAGYLAIPLSIILFGNPLYVIPYMIAFNLFLPFLVIVLTYIVTTKKENGKSVYIKTFPGLFAISIAMIFRFLKIQTQNIAIINHIDNFLTYSFYLSFIVIGSSLKEFGFNDVINNLKILKITCFIKYLLSPLLSAMIIYITLNYMKINDMYIHGTMLQSIMPPAIANIIVGKVFKLNEKLISMLLLLLTPISIATSIFLWGILL
jgi:predicted permease